MVDLRAWAHVATLTLFIPAILYLGRPVLLPLALAGVLAMVLAPLLQWLRIRGLGERWAVGFSAATLVLVVALIAGLVGLQVAQIVNDWPKISESLNELLHRGQAWLVNTAGVPAETVQNTMQRALGEASALARGFFGTLFGALGTGFVTFVLVILLLLERARIVWVVTHAVSPARRRDVGAALDEMVTVAHKYLIGKLKVMGIMAVAYFAAFSLTGVDYAPFLALLIAMSSIVPYVGNLAGGAMAIVLAVASSGGTAGLTVLAILAAAQGLENYALEPLIIGRKLSLNPFMTIFAVVVLGALWGVVGAVIALPIAGMLKVALDHASMTTAATLMTDEAPGKVP